MNEKIKELAERATDKWLGGEFFDREKFAELIVRECVEIADRCAENGSWIAGYRIKQHFGVEE